MRLGSLTHRQISIASGVVLLLTVSLIAYLALTAAGLKRHRAELNDGGIWVTNNKSVSIGRVNKPVGQIDGSLRVPGDGSLSLDVLQDGTAVVGRELNSQNAFVIDPSGVSYPQAGAVQLPSDWSVSMQAGTVAAVDPKDGGLRAFRAGEGQLLDLGPLDVSSKPTVKVGGDSAVVVDSKGDVVAVSAAKQTLTKMAAQDGFLKAPKQEKLGSALKGAPRLTSVGLRTVILDSASGAVLVDGEKVATVSTDVVLQQPSKSGDRLVFLEGSELRAMDLDSGETSTLADVQESGGSQPADVVQIKGCAFGAWGGKPAVVAQSCPGEESRAMSITEGAASPAFRVNRGQVLLNDRETGATWNIDSDKPVPTADWQAIVPPDQPEKKKDKNTNDPEDSKPQAVDDPDMGVRAGQTTTLYVLDNDLTPNNKLLAIREISPASDPSVRLSPSPDGQTVQVDLPQGYAGRTIRFSYTIDAGDPEQTDPADVTLTVRGDDAGAAPTRRYGWKPADNRTWQVNAGGTIQLPVLADWRDYADGDKLAVTGAELDSEDGRVAVTAGGQIRFTAPVEGGRRRVTYTVTDSYGQEVEEDLKFDVIEKIPPPVKPTAMPDVVSGEVGKPIVISPLGNDLPGLDPLIIDPELKLTRQVQGPGKISVDTEAGEIVFRSPDSGTKVLTYGVSYGDQVGTGTIRVDVARPDKKADPITMPDSVRLSGSAPAVVDVLANDLDPTGGLLTVQSVELADPRGHPNLDFAVVQGRWIRVMARGELPRPVALRYRVSNGPNSGVAGELLVSWAPGSLDEPVAVTDVVKVRAGQATEIPVLDNDFSPNGDVLMLEQNVQDAPAGQLPVPEGMGAAYVGVKTVRFVAAAGFKTQQHFTMPYALRTAGGGSTSGVIEMTIVPEGENRPPQPVPAEGRVTAGDVATVAIPTLGVDPDGDPVTVVGLSSNPTLGVVGRIGANAVEYHAFPDSAGTDLFEYIVEDSYGERATAVARVAVTQPGAPQPPIAVDDIVTVSPGGDVLVDVLANDVVAPGDRATVDVIDPDSKKLAKLDADSGLLRIQAPETDNSRARVAYVLDDGISAPSTGVVTVKTREGFNNPPVVADSFAELKDAKTLTAEVDLGVTMFDPEGTELTVKLPEPLEEVDGKTTVKIGERPQVIPYVVTDEGGASAVAFIYVPGFGAGPPMLVPDAKIALDLGEKQQFSLADLVFSPRGREVSLIRADDIAAYPAGLAATETTSENTFKVTAGKKDGVGAVTLKVTDAVSPKDSDALSSFLVVPTTVGDPQPVVNCPSDGIVLMAGGREVTVDIRRFCHVWTADPADAENLDYDVSWAEELAGVTTKERDGQVTIHASGEASPHAAGRLAVKVAGADSAVSFIAITVVEAPPPTIRPVRIDGLRAGESKTVDLAAYAYSPLLGGAEALRIVDAEQVSGKPVATEINGSELTVTPGDSTFGNANIRVRMTDIDGDRPARQVEGLVTVEVMDEPSVPGRPSPETNRASQQATIYWRPSDPHGAEIVRYEGQYRSKEGDSGDFVCPTTRCTVTGLTNGDHYEFQVRAVNAAGESKYSPWSMPWEPNIVPNAPLNLQVVPGSVRDHGLTLTWSPPDGEGSVAGYIVSGWGGNRKLGADQTTFPVPNLDNNREYQFKVQATNVSAPRGGPAATVSGQSSGRPAAPTGVRAEMTDGAANSDEMLVAISWNPTPNVNGPVSATYSVWRDGTKLVDGISGTSFTDRGLSYDGTSRRYTVKATNATGGELHTSENSEAAVISSVGTPNPATNLTTSAPGTNGDLIVSFNVGPIRDSRATATVSAGGATKQVSVSSNQAGISVTLPGLVNGNPYTPTVVVRNSTQQSPSVSAPSERPYGPLNNSNVSVSGYAQGRQACYNVQVDTNGRPANIQLSGNRGTSRPWSNIDNRGFNATVCTDISYETTETVTLTVSDGARGSGSKSTSVTTGAWPRGTEDWQGSGAATGCTWGSPCYAVRLILRSWKPNSTIHCSIPGSPGVQSWTGNFVVDGGGNWSGDAPRLRWDGSASWNPNTWSHDNCNYG